jgi:hypothetical protein
MAEHTFQAVHEAKRTKLGSGPPDGKIEGETYTWKSILCPSLAIDN